MGYEGDRKHPHKRPHSHVPRSDFPLNLLTVVLSTSDLQTLCCCSLDVTQHPTQYLLLNQHRRQEENQLWANIWFFFSPSFMVLVNILSEAACCMTEGLKETAVCRELI